MPDISIIIPVYNAENYLPAMIQSLKKQKGDFEVIFVDNNSSDKSMEICKTFPGAKILQESKKGPICARERGLHVAKGDYLWFIDADDRISEYAIEIITQAIREHPDMILFRADLPMQYPKKGGFLGKDEIREYLKDLLLYQTPNALWNKVFSKKVVKIRDYPENLFLGEDVLQYTPYLADIESFYFINTPLYYYRKGNGLSKQYSLSMYDSMRVMNRELSQYFGKAFKRWGINRQVLDKRIELDTMTMLKNFIVSGANLPGLLDKIATDDQEYKNPILSWIAHGHGKILWKRRKKNE